MDNRTARKIAGGRDAIEAAGARLIGDLALRPASARGGDVFARLVRLRLLWTHRTLGSCLQR